MAQGMNSSKTAARPSHEATDSHVSATEVGKSKEKKLDDTAMQAAKRAENRILANEERNPNDTMFTK